MTMNEYQRAAQRTSRERLADRQTDGLNLKQLENGLMGLCGEAGECMDLLKKHRHQGHPLHKNHLTEELGDVLWYCAETAAGLGVSLDEVAAKNIRKLQHRYPEGFDTRRSVERPEDNSII